MSKLRLTIDSDLADVHLVGLSVHKVCEHLLMDEVEAYQVELCTVEALTNVIRHSYGNQPGHDVLVTLTTGDGRLDVEIASEGTPMPAGQVERLLHGSQIPDFSRTDRSALPEGGMGLQIIHKVMNEIAYSSKGSVNRLRMTKFRRQAGTTPG